MQTQRTDRERLRILVVEDSPDDAELNLLQLKQAGFAVDARRVETEEAFREALDEGHADLVLSDHSMPQFDALRALQLLRSSDPDTPFVLVSGAIGESGAVEVMKAGANDYVLKDRLSRLVPCVERELREATVRRRMKALEKEAAEQGQRLDTLISNLPGMVFTLAATPGFPFRYVSEGCAELCGYAAERLQGHASMDYAYLVHPYDRARVSLEIERSLTVGHAFTIEHRLLCEDGRVAWVWARGTPAADPETGETLLECFATDITERRRERERLDFLADHDALTGLVNRSFFEEKLEAVVARSRANQVPCAVLVVDLDHFKEVNDSLGHRAGDEFLKKAAVRIADAVRRSDTVARFGGDEFAILMEDAPGTSAATALAETLCEVLRRPVELDGQEVAMGASIGIACAPEDAEHPGDLLRHADAALHSAKEAGRNGYRFFTAEMNQRSRLQLAMRTRIPAALERGEFELHFQPRRRLADDRLLGAEALMRWNHPEEGLLQAGHVIPIAEELGLTDGIDDWVIREGCRRLGAWQDLGLDLDLSVNVSARRFRTPGLPQVVARALQEFAVHAEQLIIEVTETTLMWHSGETLATLEALAELGVRLSIDDFGTGYSSLNYLKQFPIHAVKIDRSFIEQLPDSEDDVQIVTAVVALARSLRLQVVVEGIETAGQAELVTRLGCDEGQGFLYARPMPYVEFVEYLESA